MVNIFLLGIILSSLLNYQSNLKIKVLGATVDSPRINESGYLLRINVLDNREEVFKNGVLTEVNPVSTGAPERFGLKAGTPLGRFRIASKIATDPQGEFGPYFLGLQMWENKIWVKSEVGLHGTNEPQLIGQDASHGCIRHYNETIIRLANLLPIGTIVEMVE